MADSVACRAVVKSRCQFDSIQKWVYFVLLACITKSFHSRAYFELNRHRLFRELLACNSYFSVFSNFFKFWLVNSTEYTVLELGNLPVWWFEKNTSQTDRNQSTSFPFVVQIWSSTLFSARFQKNQVSFRKTVQNCFQNQLSWRSFWYWKLIFVQVGQFELCRFLLWFMAPKRKGMQRWQRWRSSWM